MGQSYRFTQTFDLDGSEREVTYSFTVAWGSPESGRFGPPENYDPGAGDVVEGISVLLIDGKPGPFGWAHHDERELVEMLVDAADIDAMLQSAIADADAEADRALEHFADLRRDDLMMERLR